VPLKKGRSKRKNSFGALTFEKNTVGPLKIEFFSSFFFERGRLGLNI
jgi:hypothetical protein